MWIFVLSTYCSLSVSILCDTSIYSVKPSLLQRHLNSYHKSIEGNTKDIFDAKRKKNLSAV